MADSKPMKVALRGLRDIAKSFTEPDDDFESIVVLETKDGNAAILPIGFFMETETSKELLAEVVLPVAIRKMEVQRLVFVTSAWAVSKEVGEMDPRPSEDPDRYEIVIATEMTADGVVDDRWAYIDRDPFGVAPPQLGEFEQMPTAEHSGRFVDPLVAALKEVKGSV